LLNAIPPGGRVGGFNMMSVSYAVGGLVTRKALFGAVWPGTAVTDGMLTKGEEARQLLAPVSGWFTEGFDTADLQEAGALLDALAS
jgi:hypothetical protein